MSDDVVSLSITVIGGKALAAKDRNGLSDPYVKIYLLDENHKKDKLSKQKTNVQKKTLNPEWNAKFTYILQKKHKFIQFACWDKDKIGQDFMGEIEVPLNQLELNYAKEGWYKLGQKFGNKKEERVSGEIKLLLKLSSVGASKSEINEKQKTAKIINKLFKSTISPYEISCEIPCTVVDKNGLCGSVVASNCLYFYSDQIKGKRKSKYWPWSSIVNISLDAGNVLVIDYDRKGKGKKKTIKFDLVNESENALEQLIGKWKELVTSTAPIRKKKKKVGSIRFKSFAEKTDKEEYEPIEYSDISEFTEVSTTDLTAISDEDTNESGKTSDDEDIEPVDRVSFKEGPPVTDTELKRELNIASIPVLTTSSTGSSILSSSPCGSIRIRASISPFNADDPASSLILKLILIQCQDLSSKHSKNTCPYVELTFGNQVKISRTELNTLFPIFNQNFTFNYKKEEKETAVQLGVWHKSKGAAKDSFIGETTMILSEILSSPDSQLAKELQSKRRFSRKKVQLLNRPPFHSLGRILLDFTYLPDKRKLTIQVIECARLHLVSNTDVSVTVAVGEQVNHTASHHTDSPAFSEKFEYKSVKPTDKVILKVNQSSNTIGALLFEVGDIINGEILYELLPENIALESINSQEKEGTRGEIDLTGVPGVPGVPVDKKPPVDPKLYATLPVLPKSAPPPSSKELPQSQPKLATNPIQKSTEPKAAQIVQPVPAPQPKVETPAQPKEAPTPVATVPPATAAPPAKSNLLLYLAIVVVIIALILGYFLIL